MPNKKKQCIILKCKRPWVEKVGTSCTIKLCSVHAAIWHTRAERTD
jgi:hypothetical protein